VSADRAPATAGRLADAWQRERDCLFLNVWAPAALRPGAPVLVWIHGGGNNIGTAADTDGSALARRGIVVVTMNYRLGALGFLAHPALSAEAADHASGDYGLADQQAALRWVRRNIGAFGGDPRRVTLGGQSAGSADTCAHLTSPTARGLFRAAIQESGSCVTAMSAASQSAGTTNGLAFVAAVGCPDPARAAACLRAVPPAALVAAGGGVLAGLLDAGRTPAGVRSPLSVGCHCAARSGKSLARLRLCEDTLPRQTGHPLGFAVRARVLIGARQL
jgi:para-nitrobenzyl esterase